MDVSEFAAIFENQFQTSDSILNSKREEYANDNDNVDVLHNFRQAAHLEQTNMRAALGGFLAKHVVSIFDMIHEEELRDMAVWDEKITDALNYLILLKAIVVEEASETVVNISQRRTVSIVNHPSSGGSHDNRNDPDKDS